MQSILHVSGRVMVLLFVTLFISCFVGSCSKKNITLPASLQKITEEESCECEPYIDEYTLNGNTVYMYGCSGPGCYCFAMYYDAAGKEFRLDSGQSAVYRKHIWSCKK